MRIPIGLWLSATPLALVLCSGCATMRVEDRVHLSERVGDDPQWSKWAHAATTPAWAKEALPKWVLPYLSGYGREEPWGEPVAGIDRWQANTFIWYTPETAKYLYGDYTPLQVDHRRGCLPAYEKVVERHTRGLKSDKDKALALLEQVSVLVPHPIGIPVPPPPPHPKDRALDDEALLASGWGFCNEQARVFCRLCQVAGIPARIVFANGHVLSEFYADGRWSLADQTYRCVFPHPEKGHLMSAAECHGSERIRKAATQVYFDRYFRKIADTYTDEQICGKRYTGIADAAERKRAMAKLAEHVRKSCRLKDPKHWHRFREWGGPGREFGMANYPLPTQGSSR